MTKKKTLPEEVLRYFRTEGRKGGLTGGKIRADNLSPERRKAIAKKAALARWGKKKGTSTSSKPNTGD
jgi:hypothetical protein